MKLVLSVVIILALGYNLRKYWSIKKLQMYCIYCNSHRNEWFGLKRFIENRGRCFYCRIDYLDAKYGPSETAELWKRQCGRYNRPPLNNRERKVKK